MTSAAWGSDVTDENRSGDLRVSMTIPVYNEESTVGEVIDRVSALDDRYEIVVVDDGSTDRTAEVSDHGSRRCATSMRAVETSAKALRSASASHTRRATL